MKDKVTPEELERMKKLYEDHLKENKPTVIKSGGARGHLSWEAIERIKSEKKKNNE